MEDNQIFEQAILAMEELYGSNCTEEIDAYYRGAKWQLERSYSEEDMIEFGKFIFKNTLLVNVKGVEGILEQFKKK